MEIVPLIQKLIALALNNPNRAEAESAAMRAVSLIVEQDVTLGGKPALGYISSKKQWTPDTEFDEFWDRMGKRGNDEEYDPAAGNTAGDNSIKAAEVDTDLDDDFMRKRIKVAWRAIRKERKRLDAEIYRYEMETHRHYTRDGV